MLRWLQTLPTSFPNFEGSSPCIDIPCFWTLVSMQQVSLWLVNFLLSLFGFDPFATVSWWLGESSLVDSLESFRSSTFELPCSQFPGAWPILRIDSRSPTWWWSFLLVLAVRHQIHRSCFCCRWAIVRGCFLSSFWHGTNHNVLSILGENFWNGYKNTSRNSLYWANTTGAFFTWFFLRSFRHHFKTIGGTEKADVEQTQKTIPLITCETSFGENQRVGFWCQQFWFGFRVPHWFCQTTNQEQLYGSCKHLIVGHLPFLIILITASLSSKNVQLRFTLRRMCVRCT